MAASYEAKARGVRTAMGGTQAKRLCPDAVVVPCRFEAYTEASKAVFKVFEDYAPVVEALSIDEAFLDVRGLEHIKGTPREIAARLRSEVLEKVGLPITVGVARTKFLAKVASGVAKPDGLLVVEPDRELEFLHPLPVERLWGVGEKTARKLHAHNLFTVGQVARVPEPQLIEMLGRGSGRQVHALAHNRDPRRVRTRSRRRSIGAQHGFGITPQSLENAEVTLIGLVDRVARRMRAAQRMARTVVLRLRFRDFTRAPCSFTLSEATWHTEPILTTARALLAASAPLIAERGLTLVGVALTNLEDAGSVQLTLPFEPDREGALDVALDDIRRRFGSSAITRAVLVGRDERPSVPLLPD